MLLKHLFILPRSGTDAIRSCRESRLGESDIVRQTQFSDEVLEQCG